MPTQESKVKTYYILAWLGEHNGMPSAFFEMSTARLFRGQSVISCSVERDNRKVVVFCDFVHGDGYLKQDELCLIAEAYLNESYNTIDINLRY